MRCFTYAGQPIPIPQAARIVSPFPRPSALYIAGAKSGNPNPARDRKKEAAARAVRNVNQHGSPQASRIGRR